VPHPLDPMLLAQTVLRLLSAAFPPATGPAVDDSRPALPSGTSAGH
jgi:hypothetical protein